MAKAKAKSARALRKGRMEELPESLEPTKRMKPERREFSEKKRELVLQILSEGGTVADAAAMANISRRMISYTAENDIEFAAALERVEAENRMHHIRRIRTGERQWQSSAWFLERKYAKEFSVGRGENSDEQRTVFVRKITRNQADLKVAEQKKREEEARVETEAAREDTENANFKMKVA